MKNRTDALDFLQNISPDDPMHPRNALCDGGIQPQFLPVCDHYCGVEPRMSKSLALQRDMAREYGRNVFDVTLDCEDGAPVGKEQEHAELIGDLLLANFADEESCTTTDAGISRRVAVRVHPTAHSSFAADVNTIVQRAGHLLAFVMLPKVECVHDVERALAVIDAAAQKNPMAAASATTSHLRLPVHCLIESANAVANAFAIAAHPRVESLSFGLMDFVSSHHGAIPATAMSVQGQFEHPLTVRAKLEIAAACHAFGKTPSHCVVTEYQNTQELSNAAEKASRQLGYTRMWSIHPRQIKPILTAMTPSAAAVSKAQAVIEAALAAQWAPISFDGKLEDRASYRFYWNVLQRSV